MSVREEALNDRCQLFVGQFRDVRSGSEQEKRRRRYRNQHRAIDEKTDSLACGLPAKSGHIASVRVRPRGGALRHRRRRNSPMWQGGYERYAGKET